MGVDYFEEQRLLKLQPARTRAEDFDHYPEDPLVQRGWPLRPQRLASSSARSRAAFLYPV